MHTEPTGRTPHETREAYDLDRCDGCQGRLAYPHTIKTHKPCACTPGGHRAWYCFDCQSWTYEPPCTSHDHGTASAYD